MSQTAESLRRVLGNTFSFYFKAHSFHWNVQGPLFAPMHQFFGALYAEVFAAVDTTAEQIRALGQMAPTSISELLIPAPPETHTIPASSLVMIEQLIELNQYVLESLYVAHEDATTEKHDGVVNFIEGRIDAHAKIMWQLRAHL